MSGEEPDPSAPEARSGGPVPSPGGGPREVEVKFRADAAVFEAVRAALLLQGAAFGPPRELVSTYFDTPARDLRRHGHTLRVRRKGRGAAVLGVKWISDAADDHFSRGEVEVRSPAGEPDVTLFEPELGDRLTEMLDGQPLAPVFETRFRRSTTLIRHGRSEIELSLDEGAIVAGSQRLPLSEVELELKSGSAADLVGFARTLAGDCRLSLELEPKAGRGHRLVAGSVAAFQKAKPLVLPAAASVDDLVAMVISHTLGHFLSNWTALRESDAPEAVHQLRVALRRMRSAIGVFRKVLPLPLLDDLRAEARRIASALGPARECDAFRQNALAGAFRAEAERVQGVPQLMEAVEARRQHSYAAARALMEDPLTTLFVLDVQDLLLQRPWRTALAPAELGLLTTEARALAATVLGRLRKRVLKRGRALPDLPDEARHELRIALKNLRYAAEFFGSLFGDGKERRNFLTVVSELQEHLGIHNDAATAAAFIAALELPLASEARFAAGYLLGYDRHASMVADAQLMKKWKAFRRAAEFWEERR